MTDVERFISLLNTIYSQPSHNQNSTESDSSGDDDLDGEVHQNEHELFKEVIGNTCTDSSVEKSSIYHMVKGREQGRNVLNYRGQVRRSGFVGRGFGRKDKMFISHRFVPNKLDRVVDHSQSPVFTSLFSADGSTLMSSTEDHVISLFETENWTCQKVVQARDVQYAIIGSDFSPNGEWLIYSSWSQFVHIVNARGDHETHQKLDMAPERGRFCLFSICFSPDSKEVLAGSSDRHIYIYDIDRKERIARLGSHDDDVNAVAFADDSNQIFYSGSDDTLIKIWDRRVDSSGCVGVLPGHTEGITYIDSKKDGRYLISNGKDQCIKLWDIRNMQDHTDYKGKSSSFHYNTYFGQSQIENILKKNRRHPDDQSIMTYRGPHRILQTLIRCKFSPMETTGQRYIYTGSSDGVVYIYDMLSGDLVQKLSGHNATVRDMHWHPTKPTMVTSSWDGTVKKWDYEPDKEILVNKL